MNKTPLAAALAAFVLVLGTGACARSADQPENSADAAPSTAAASDTTATVTPPSGNDSANAVGNTTGMPADMSGTAGTTASGTSGDSALGDSAMGGTSTGGAINNEALQQELQRCDQLSGAERDTCRTDAQNRYDQTGSGAPATQQ